MESPNLWWSCPPGGGPESHWTTMQSFKLLIVSWGKVWIKAYVITEAELWLWVTLPAIICVIRSHESRCVWGLKCLGGVLKAEIQMADNWCCRRSFTPLSTHLYSHDCRVDQQLPGPPKLDNPTGVHRLLEVTKPPGWKLKRLHEPKRKSASVVISNAEDWEPPPTDKLDEELTRSSSMIKLNHSIVHLFHLIHSAC